MKRARRLAAPLLSLLFAACAVYQVPKSLDPESQEFLSKVRYLISQEEHKTFIALPAAERSGFIEKFWRERDPVPETEANEFKVQYFQRIDDANRLFREGSTAGWLGDRGKLYIQIGPPDNRVTYPQGYQMGDRPQEIWYYGFFMLSFVDESLSGNYQLSPSSSAQISEITKTRAMHRGAKTAVPVRAPQDIPLEVFHVQMGEVLLRVKFPYQDIWFEAAGSTFRGVLDLTAEVLDSSGKKVWDTRKSYPFSLAKENFRGLLGQTYLMEIPVKLEPGVYALTLTIKNGRSGAVLQKKVSLII